MTTIEEFLSNSEYTPKLCTYQFKAGGGGGGGRAWGGDLIVIVGPGVGLLTDLAFPEEGIFESVFAQSGDSEHRLE